MSMPSALAQINGQFEFGRKLERQIGWFGSIEDAIDAGGRPR
jgi:hypothetical protein